MMTSPRQRHARWAAQHASQHLPVRRARAPVAMLAPVGDAYLSAAINEGIRAGCTNDEPCKCGYLVCCFRGPCGPAVAPAPASGAARFKVGDRVRVIDGTRELPRGSDHVVRGIYADGASVPYLVLEGDASQGGWKMDRFEHAAAAPAEEWTPPAPWVRDESGDWGYGAPYAEYACKHGVLIARDSEDTHDWTNTTAATLGGSAPTLAQACAMALGITLEDRLTRGHVAILDGAQLSSGADAEACARLAVERHARGGRS